MNYRHAFHAGNFADVVKHAVLVRILNFEKIRETAFRPWAAQTIPRRFCSGIVEISDGRRHIIHYSIAEDSGMIGASWGVEWCIVGLDRNWSYNPACKMARP